MRRFLYWLGFVTVADYEQAMREKADEMIRADKLHDDIQSLYWHLGLPWNGLPPMRWRHINEPKDERFAAAVARIDELKRASR